MSLAEYISKDTSEWLLDDNDPGASYLARYLLFDLKENDQELKTSRKIAHKSGPIRTIMNAMHPDGYWEKDGPGYLPKYRSTVWALILLAQLGAKVGNDKRIEIACQRYLDSSLSENGQISSKGPPSGTVDCLQGNMLSSFLDLDFQDPRLDKSFEWMARSVTGEGVSSMSEKSAPLRYYSGKIGPDFQCGANNKLSCAWGAAKVMLAFSKLPEEKKTPLINNAIKRGVDYLFSIDPASADYPNGWNSKPSGNWWKFGFPVFYVTDLLQIAESLARLGYASDTRLGNTIQLIVDKQDSNGRWQLEYDYSGKSWIDFGPKKMPSKWVTIRALNVLKYL